MPYDHRLDDLMEPFFDIYWIEKVVDNREPVSVSSLEYDGVLTFGLYMYHISLTSRATGHSCSPCTDPTCLLS